MKTGNKKAEPIDSDTHKDTKDLVRGALINYLGMLAKVSKLLFVLVAARVYGVPELGLYFLAWAAISYLVRIRWPGNENTVPHFGVCRGRVNELPILVSLGEFYLATSQHNNATRMPLSQVY